MAGFTGNFVWVLFVAQEIFPHVAAAPAFSVGVCAGRGLSLLLLPRACCWLLSDSINEVLSFEVLS